MYKLFNVKSFDFNRRIDNWIFSYIKNVPKSAIYRMIRKGKILINNNKINPSYKLKVNDKIKIINLILNNNCDKDNNKLINDYFISKKFYRNILYEDNYILAINKPYGMPVHGGTNIRCDIISNIKQIYNKNYELVHRLDKSTSGILLIAKDKYILRNLHNQFNSNKIYKKYLTLVCGTWNKKNNLIDLPIFKTVSKSGKKIFIVNKLGKRSISIFYIKEFFDKMTLMEVIPITGRTHQIRVHSSFVGNPIALDKTYGDFKKNNKLLLFGLKRTFLHSNIIKFIHPITNKKISIYSKIEEDLLKFLKYLRTNKFN